MPLRFHLPKCGRNGTLLFAPSRHSLNLRHINNRLGSLFGAFLLWHRVPVLITQFLAISLCADAADCHPPARGRGRSRGWGAKERSPLLLALIQLRALTFYRFTPMSTSIRAFSTGSGAADADSQVTASISAADVPSHRSVLATAVSSGLS